MRPPEGIIRRRTPKPTRPPPPPPRTIPPLRPPVFQRFQLREKGHTIGDVQQPEGMDEPPKVKYDPKKLKCMKKDLAKINKKIRRSKKKHDHMIRKRNNLKKAIEVQSAAERDMQRSKPTPQPKPAPPPRQPGFRELEQAFGRAYKSYRTMGRPRIDSDTFFVSIRKRLIQLISRELKDLTSARVQTTAWIHFRPDFQFVELAFDSRMTDFHKASDIESLVNLMINHIIGQIENPTLINSRFVLEEVLFMDVNFHRLNLTRGGTHLPLPTFIEAKRAIINPQNQDDECFKWAVLAALHNPEIKCNPERISKLRKFESMYDWSDISFPTSLKDIVKFEFKNSLTINVLGLEGANIYLCRKGTPGHKLVNLLLVCDGDKWHYMAVKSLSRLLKSSNSKHKAKQHFCMNCLQGSSQENTRDDHYVYCSNNKMVRVEMPKDPIFKFSNGQGQLKAPFMIYANFEYILEPMATASNDPSIPHFNHINKHTPSGFCTYSMFAYGDIRIR